MSHLTTFKNKALVNTKRQTLIAAVAEIEGLELDFDHKNIKNTWINESVDASFKKNGSHISVGLRFGKNAEGEEEVTVAGDFWNTGLNQQQLTDRIAQVYTKHNVMDICREANWFINEEDVVTEANGDIVIQAYRYA